MDRNFNKAMTLLRIVFQFNLPGSRRDDTDVAGIWCMINVWHAKRQRMITRSLNANILIAMGKVST